MGGKDERHARPTNRFDARELAKLTATEIVSIPLEEVEDPFGGWEEQVLGDGTPQKSGPLMSRTQTVSDPMTTGLLAEVSRRAPTIGPSDLDDDDHTPVEPPKRKR
jgi:hypothetical protein